MTPTSCLYFHSPDSGAPPVLLAKDYSDWESFPFLWRLLLSEGQPAGPLPLSTKGDKVTGSIRVSARDAIDKMAYFSEYIAAHPLLHRLPELPVFLASVLSFLRERLATFPAREAKKIELVAQASSCGLPDPGLMQDIEVDWLDIQLMAIDNEYHGLDKVLGFTEAGYSFERWEGWANRFGLSTLSHPYFSRLEYSMYWEKYLPPPDALTIQQFVRAGGTAEENTFPDQTEDPPSGAWSMLKGFAQSLGLMRADPPPVVQADAGEEDEEEEEEDEEEEDEDEDEDEEDEDEDEADADAGAGGDWPGEAFYQVVIDGKVGLRFVEQESVQTHREFDGPNEDPNVLALPAEWDEIIRECRFSAYVRRGALWGVVQLRRHCRVIMEPCFDAVMPAGRDSPSYVMKDGRYGQVDTDTGAWHIPPEYDEMVYRNDGGESAWQVRKGKLWGVVTARGVVKQPCIYDSMMPDQSGNYLLEDHGWLVLKDGRAGWVTMLGDLDVACEWDEIRPCVSAGLYVVGRDGRWGLVVQGNKLWVPCEYLHLAPLAIAARVKQKRLFSYWHRGLSFWDHTEDLIGEVEKCDPALSNLLIAVTTDTGVGVVDQAHRQLVPCVYQAINAARVGEYHDPRWLPLVGKNGLQGLWSVAAGAEIFPCTHEALDVFAAPTVEHPLVGTLDNGRYRLWNMDGTPAFDATFIGISARKYTNTPQLKPGVGYGRSDIANDWRRGKAVRATQDVDGEIRLVYLLPGQPILTEHEILVRDYMSKGDRMAAYTLAEHYLEGFHCEKDPATARLWAARACGHEPSPVVQTAVAPVLSEEDDDDDDEGDRLDDREDQHEAKDQADLRVEAAFLFATMLNEGQGGPRDAPLARKWAHEALYGRANSSSMEAQCRVLLGKLMLDESAGPVDLAGAYEVLQEVSAPSWSEGEATFYSARCLERGVNGAPDLETARMLMVRADANEVEAAAPALATILTTLAQTAPAAQAQHLLREAAYYTRKAKAAEERKLNGDDD